MRKGGLEPPWIAPPDPKSGASANSATFALIIKALFFAFSRCPLWCPFGSEFNQPVYSRLIVVRAQMCIPHGHLNCTVPHQLGDGSYEELLHQGRSQRANLIVMGAQDASQFAAATRASIVYTVLAYAQCPVITLSPIVLAGRGAGEDQPHSSELCMAGGF